MRLIFIIYTIVCTSVTIYSCGYKSKDKNIFLKNPTCLTLFDTLNKSEKGLLLISNKSGCSICELFEVDLMKDETFSNAVFNNYIIARIDENVLANRWLARILNRASFPVFIGLDNSFRIKFIEMGIVPKSRMKVLLDIKKNQSINY